VFLCGGFLRGIMCSFVEDFVEEFKFSFAEALEEELSLAEDF